jgi:predicted membrane chloride channel (bestrophin family)
MDIVKNNIYLRILSAGYVGDKYVEWMGDEETVRFLESRWKTYTLENLKEYVNKINENHAACHYGE